MNKHAQKLGRLARGVPKHYSPEELERRRARFGAVAAKARWAKKKNTKL
jgi:hypothetical protein